MEQYFAPGHHHGAQILECNGTLTAAQHLVTGVNEILSTIMMNVIAAQLLSFLLLALRLGTGMLLRLCPRLGLHGLGRLRPQLVAHLICLLLAFLLRHRQLLQPRSPLLALARCLCLHAAQIPDAGFQRHHYFPFAYAYFCLRLFDCLRTC